MRRVRAVRVAPSRRFHSRRGPGRDSPPAAESSGSTGAVLIAAFDAANRGEVFVVKAADPGTLHRVTATGALSEAPVGALTGSCSTGGGLTVWGLVAALALRRLRRRRS